MGTSKRRSGNNRSAAGRPENCTTDKKVPTTAESSQSEAARRFQVAQARREFRHLTHQIKVIKEQLEQTRQARLKTMVRVESHEERAARSRIERLTARQRNVGRWLARHGNHAPGKEKKRSSKRNRKRERGGAPAVRDIRSTGARRRARLIG